MILPTPLYHCLGSVGGTMVSMMHGVTLILSSPIFDGKKALEAVHNERWAWGAATHRLLRASCYSSPLRTSPPSSREKGRQGRRAPQESIQEPLPVSLPGHLGPPSRFMVGG